MTEYRDWPLIISLTLAGLAIDLIQRRTGEKRLTLGGIRTTGPIAAAVLWISYYAIMALDKGIGWEPTLWVGALMIGVLTGFGVAFLIAPPSYGPRLVDASDG